MKNKWFYIVYLLFALMPASAQKVILITDFGAVPDSWNDIVPAVQQAISACNGNENTVIEFPKGRYDFWTSHCDGSQAATVGFDLKHLKNITIEGNGSVFVFHGNMQIARLDSCENVVLKNFSVDWDRPYISQAEIVQASDTYLDVKIDKTQYPYFIENGKIMFTGEGWKLPVISAYNNLYDKDLKEIVPQTWDNPLGDIFEQKAEEQANGAVRFWGQPRMKPETGTYVTLYHARYLTTGIQIRYSKNTVLKDLIVYHALSHGVVGEMSENITMDNASMTVNEAKGRIFSIVADASHFINCKGVIKVENCAHTGQGDDFINVHGRNMVIQDIVDANTIEVKTDGRYNHPGDEMWFLTYEKAQREETRTIASVTPVYQEHKFSINYYK